MTVCCSGSCDLGLHVMELSSDKRHLQIEITFILTVCCSCSSDIGLHVLELSSDKRHLEIEITFILTVCCSSQRVFCLGSDHSGISITKPLRRRPAHTQLLLLQMAGDVHPNPGPTSKYPRPVCTRNATSQRVTYQCNRYSRLVHVKCNTVSEK